MARRGKCGGYLLAPFIFGIVTILPRNSPTLSLGYIYFGVKAKFGLLLRDVLLVRSTVANATSWSATQVVDVERATVPDLDTCEPVTTVTVPVKTDCATHLTLSYCRVYSIQPAGSVSVTPLFRHTSGRHFGARGALETIPTRRYAPIAQCTHGYIRHLSAGIGQTAVTRTI